MADRTVTIGVRTRGPVGYNKFWISLINMDKRNAGNLIPAEGYGAAEAARYIFRKFLKETTDTHLLMLDDDSTLSEHTLTRLLSRDLPIVGALTWTGGMPPLPTIWRGFSGAENNYPSFWVRQDDVAKWFEDPRVSVELSKNQELSAFTLTCEDKDLLSRTDAIGLHCVLIKREILEAVGEPFLQADDSGVREDFDFSQRIARTGTDLWVDKSVIVGHIRAHAVRPLDYYIHQSWLERDKKENSK